MAKVSDKKAWMRWHWTLWDLIKYPIVMPSTERPHWGVGHLGVRNGPESERSLRVSDPQTSARSQQPESGSPPPACFPPPPSIDRDWRERIAIAKQVREETLKARGNKPSTFDVSGPSIGTGR